MGVLCPPRVPRAAQQVPRPCRVLGSAAKTTSAPMGTDSKGWTWAVPAAGLLVLRVYERVSSHGHGGAGAKRGAGEGEHIPTPQRSRGQPAAALGTAWRPSALGTAWSASCKVPLGNTTGKDPAGLLLRPKPQPPGGDTQHSTAGASGWARGGTAPARKQVGFSLCSFSLLSGMFSNLHLGEEVCQRKYVTDCK